MKKSKIFEFCPGLSFPVLLVAVMILSADLGQAQPVITKQPADNLNAKLGSPAAFAVEVVDGEKVEYQWRLNGINIPGATTSTYVIPNLGLNDCGTYSVGVSDEKGAVNSDPALLVPEVAFVPGADFFQEAFIIGPRSELDPLQGFVRTDNTEATRETGEPQHAGMKGGKSIWFRWMAPETGIVRFTARGSGFDTLMAAYTGDAIDKLNPFSKSAQDDDGGGYSTSEINFNAEQDTVYAIAIDGFEGASGPIVLQWNLEPTLQRLPEILDVPTNRTVISGEQVQMFVNFEGQFSQRWFHNGQPTENTGKTFVIDKVDEFSVGRYSVLITDGERRQLRTVPADIQLNVSDDGIDAGTFAHDKFMAATDGSRSENPKQRTIISRSGPARGYTTMQVFSTVGATKDPGEPNHAGVVGGASEWYTYIAPDDGTLHINTDGSNYDTVLAVYTGPGFDFDSLVPVASNNKSGANGGDRVRFTTTAGTVYFIAIDGVGGASGTVQLNINLGDPPTITSAPQSRTVGVGTNATFNVTASGTTPIRYQWLWNGTNIANATNSSYTRVSARSSHAGNYRVVVSNVINVVTSSVAVLTVVIPPSISADPISQTVDAGANVNFSVTATGGAPLRYQWRLGGASISAATNSILSLTNVQSINAGEYSVVVTNIAGSVTSASALLGINAAPIITAHPGSRTATPGENVVLTVTATGSPAPVYQWFLNGASLPGETASLLSLTNFQSINEGSYHAVVSNSVGFATSDVAVLKLNAPPRTGSYSLGTNGAFSLSFIGAAGTNYVLQGSTNLVDWVPISTNISSSGFLDLTDPNATNFVGRFYRIVEE